MKKSTGSGPGKGLIGNVTEDKQAYLGHFRSEKVAKEGHNFGFGPFSIGGGNGSSSPPAPTGPTKKQLANPTFRAKHQVAAAKADVREAKRTGGDVAAAKGMLAGKKAERRYALGDVRTARQSLQKAQASPGGGAVKAARQELKGAKQAAKSQFAGAFKTQQQTRQAATAKKNGGGGFLGGLF